jgi:DNA-binding XRE family transcriptional regulator
LRQADLAELAGCSRDTISRLEAGRNQPQLATARAIAAALNIPLEAAFPARHASGAEAFPMSGITLAEHHKRTQGMTGPERLAAFGRLPQAQQDAAMKHLAEQVAAERAP